MLAPTPGELLAVQVELSPEPRALATQHRNPRLTTATLGILVPIGFDPLKSWPILAVSNTEAYSDIESMRQIKQAANEARWITVGTAPLESEKDAGDWRIPCVLAGFDYLTAAWPVSQKWPLACGGMSDGAKNSAFLPAALANAHHPLIGMLMMGCNQDMATVALRKSAPPIYLGFRFFSVVEARTRSPRQRITSR